MEKITIEEAIKRLKKLDSLVNNFYTDAVKMGIEALEKERSEEVKTIAMQKCLKLGFNPFIKPFDYDREESEDEKVQSDSY